MARFEFYHDPNAPTPNTLVPACNLLVVNDQDQLLLQKRRDTGQWDGEPTINDEASDVAWVRFDELSRWDIHPSMLRQIATYTAGVRGHVD